MAALQFVDGDGAVVAPASGDGSLASLLAGDHEESYAVVSIMGPQSSGKSTLMNKLFATPFNVMDASQGRSQTTLGIWAAKAQDLPLIVLDLLLNLLCAATSHIVEVQITLAPLLRIKRSEGHSAYAIARLHALFEKVSNRHEGVLSPRLLQAIDHGLVHEVRRGDLGRGTRHLARPGR